MVTEEEMKKKLEKLNELKALQDRKQRLQMKHLQKQKKGAVRKMQSLRVSMER